MSIATRFLPCCFCAALRNAILSAGPAASLTRRRPTTSAVIALTIALFIVGFASTLIYSLLLTFPIVTNAQGPLPNIDFDGFGPVRFGMTVRQASTVLGVPIKEYPMSHGENRHDYVGCHYAASEGNLKGVSFMISNGQIVRIDIANRTVATVHGAKIGMTETDLKRIYPNVKSVPNKYEETAHDLTVTRLEQDGSTGIMIFLSDGTEITGYRVGNSQYKQGEVPAVELIEHCG